MVGLLGGEEYKNNEEFIYALLALTSSREETMIVRAIYDIKAPYSEIDIRTLLLNLDAPFEYMLPNDLNIIGILKDIQAYDDSDRFFVLSIEIDAKYDYLFP